MTGLVVQGPSSGLGCGEGIGRYNPCPMTNLGYRGMEMREWLSPKPSNGLTFMRSMMWLKFVNESETNLQHRDRAPVDEKN